MALCDWSSDVCSSDLLHVEPSTGSTESGPPHSRLIGAMSSLLFSLLFSLLSSCFSLLASLLTSPLASRFFSLFASSRFSFFSLLASRFSLLLAPRFLSFLLLLASRFSLLASSRSSLLLPSPSSRFTLLLASRSFSLLASSRFFSVWQSRPGNGGVVGFPHWGFPYESDWPSLGGSWFRFSFRFSSVRDQEFSARRGG